MRFAKRTTVLALSIIMACAFGTGCKKKNVSDSMPTEGSGGAGKLLDASAGTELATGDIRDAILALRRVHFAFDSFDLTEDSRAALTEAGTKLADKSDVHLYVEGHADSAGETEYNLTLGEKRAKAVSAYLTKLGVAAQRLHIVSYGEEVPLRDGETKAAMAANRRVDFKLMRGEIELVVEQGAPVEQ